MNPQATSILTDLLRLARTYSGREAQPSDRIYGDLDINGGDFLEFVVAVERKFGVDLSWVSSRDPKAEAQDPTIDALADDVFRQLS
jgi:hypothetical protein